MLYEKDCNTCVATTTLNGFERCLDCKDFTEYKFMTDGAIDECPNCGKRYYDEEIEICVICQEPTKKRLLDDINKANPLDLRVSPKIAGELKQLMIDADSLLTLFVFSEHTFNEKKAERKKEAERIAIGLRKIYDSNFSG